MSLKSKIMKQNQVQRLYPFQKDILDFFESTDENDLVIHAPTGTGKTFAFVLGLALRLMRVKYDGIFAIVLVPSKALVQQMTSLISQFVDSKSLRRKIIVDTPESFFSSTKVTHLSSVRYLIIDEADRLANELYKDYLSYLQRPLNEETRIRNAWSSHCKRLLCSATFNPDGFYKEMFDLSNPKCVSVNIDTKVRELIIKCSLQSRLGYLESFFMKKKCRKVLIFVNSLSVLNELSQRFSAYNVLEYYSDIPTIAKSKIVEDFSNSTKFTILIATDALSRGVDLKGCDLVVNYCMPKTASSYVHRIGRTGRGTCSGMALSFITSRRDERIIKGREVTKLEPNMM